MKKLCLILLLVLIAFTMTACNSSDSEPAAGEQKVTDSQGVGTSVTNAAPIINTADEKETASPVGEEVGFTFKIRDSIIKMDQNMSEVKEMLGEPLKVFEEPSCAFDGIDRVFSYPGIQIHTYPKGDDDFVHTISLSDDSVKTMQGIYLGSSLNEVLDAYGNDYEMEFDVYTYTDDSTTLSFFIEDDMVMAITYKLIMKQ